MPRPGLLAYIAVAKYQDAMPLARQEKILRRTGVDLPRATLAGWMIKLAALLAPMIEQLRASLLAYDVVQIDETRIQVLEEAGRSAASDSYIWVQRGGPPRQPMVLFHYDPSRGQAPAKELLAGFAGYVQSDGYEVYTALAATRSDIRLIGCCASPPQVRRGPQGPGQAAQNRQGAGLPTQPMVQAHRLSR
jgi:transposase